jgi:hypothetical protein
VTTLEMADGRTQVAFSAVEGRDEWPQVGLTNVEMRDGRTQVGLPAKEGRGGWTQVGLPAVEMRDGWTQVGLPAEGGGVDPVDSGETSRAGRVLWAGGKGARNTRSAVFGLRRSEAVACVRK